MKNDNELFLGGDARFLSGAAASRRASDYSHRPSTVQPGDKVVTSRSIGLDRLSSRSIPSLLESDGVRTRTGRNGYHHRPEMNVFLREGEWPSAGVELETEERSSVSRSTLEQALVSNWFHFESDGSLVTTAPDGTRREGYELITEPLPPRFYRNPRLWAGLQNILTPWVESWSFPQTGLHVHVGLTQFEEMAKELSFLYTDEDRRTFAKFLIAYLYFEVVDRHFSDRVFLRKAAGYCATPSIYGRLFVWRRGMTGGDVVSSLFASLLQHGNSGGFVSLGNYAEQMYRLSDYGVGYATAQTAAKHVGLNDRGVHTGGGIRRLLGVPSEFSGHHTEVNMGNPQTIEFRRGKGTLNHTSILRMVEFTTLLARYAAHILRKPDEEVSPESVYRYMLVNTTSGALATLAEQQLKGE